MDQVVNLNRAPVTKSQVETEILKSFLCWDGLGTACISCHPTCNGCTGDLCNSCLDPRASKVADGSFCLCGTSPAWEECRICHASCNTCSSRDNPEKCNSCLIRGAILNEEFEGSCSCLHGFVYQKYATSPCVPCSSGCSYCIDATAEGCMNSKDLTIFASNLASFYSLPYLSETNGYICYREPLPKANCDYLYSVFSGAISSDDSGLHPTLAQCYKLLRSEWGYVTNWFAYFFPRFDPPGTFNERYEMKTVLWLWILQFGPTAMRIERPWMVIASAFNDPTVDWRDLLAWSNGFRAQRATQSYPNGLTPSPIELNFFNRFSSVCSTASCAYKTQCQEVAPMSTCAIS